MSEKEPEKEQAKETEDNKAKIKNLFNELEKELDGLSDDPEALSYAEWMLKKAQLRYTEANKEHGFPILYSRVYWAHMGLNIGSEEDKHRPVVIVRSERKSTICHVVPLTTQRLEDEYWYHVDLEGFENTALVEHFRIISKDRIDKPLWKGGEISVVSTPNMKQIHNEIKRLFGTYRPPR
ncbi:TPA: type II toxin-antitoxin system PemK/MazF family toxin [Bacillus cereus]|uniref:type II toxin-antitoxin system PemK/MazF family toxin n=1 Tax=Bacillus sp. FSL R9-6406 TaxID=2978207 RepID=UPI0030F617FD|nr:type II toxin-antitoxin system PemK/MazF family toxin [Bacillus cereus]HDR7176574.1 type II toxin-antitoxin system PemK/MazF family toxin [Bacillus cereus]HDR7975521.1 type II toxin-antitoxin system PemK/MazF family toxin [Bacillus cereus]